MADLQQAIDGKEIERVEIELLDSGRFRWKLWSKGELIFCTMGDARPAEIDAMLRCTSLLVKGSLGVLPHEEEFSEARTAAEAKRLHELRRSDRSDHSLNT
jgi:hypothetical protein